MGAPIPDQTAAEQLRTALCDARAKSGLDITTLARRSGLARTTVSQALNSADRPPSAHTVAALARALNTEPDGWLEIRRAALDAAGRRAASTVDAGEHRWLGRPIRQCDPLDLEVKPAGDSTGRIAEAVLPRYVRRAHDVALAGVVAKAAGGASAMAVLVGSSSTGKTRACWEAVQPLAELGWRLWHPFDPTRADAALNGLERVGPRTVLWLNEAQHYLGAGEELAAALHGLLTDPERGPVLVLGTLWPAYYEEYAARPEPGVPDPHARVRELLAGRHITVPEVFDEAALARAREMATDGDRLLGAVLLRAHGGRVAQYLAGAPELLRRYENASPPAKALLHAAMDGRRLGVGLYLPVGLLADAVADYMNADAYDALDTDWLERVLADLARPVHGDLAPLRRVKPRPHYGPIPSRGASPAAGGSLYRLADYLEQHGRITRRALCPPASFWCAAQAHLTNAEDLHYVAGAARSRGRLKIADGLYQKLVGAGDIPALTDLASSRRKIGDRDGAEQLYWRSVEAGNASALIRLADLRKEAGDRDGAEELYWRAVEAGKGAEALVRLADLRTETGDEDGAWALQLAAGDAGNPCALTYLGILKERAGDREAAESLYQSAFERGDKYALTGLGRLREAAGDLETAETLYQRAFEGGDAIALVLLSRLLEEAGDSGAVEALWSRDVGFDVYALARRIDQMEEAGDRGAVEALYHRAVNAGLVHVLVALAQLRSRAGDQEAYEALYSRAAAAGDEDALLRVAELREKAGEWDEAEALYHRAADAGHTFALDRLAGLAKKAEQGDAAARYRYGLNPDGTPTTAWR